MGRVHGSGAAERAGAWRKRGGGGGGWGLGNLDLNLDLDEGWRILLVWGLLILATCVTGGYLVYAAPEILGNCAINTALAGSLNRGARRADAGHWAAGVLRSTILPFAVVLILAGALGYAASSHCPSAARLAEALACPER